MQVSYGPPGAAGVTQLMAVGASEFDETTTDAAVRSGLYLSAAAAGLGVFTGSRTVRNLGLGAAIALFLVRAAGRRRQQVVVTQPAPVPAGRWR